MEYDRTDNFLLYEQSRIWFGSYTKGKYQYRSFLCLYNCRQLYEVIFFHDWGEGRFEIFKKTNSQGNFKNINVYFTDTMCSISQFLNHSLHKIINNVSMIPCF